MFFRSIRYAVLLSTLLFVPAWLAAGDLDAQCARGAEKPLLQQSIFAHGFMHGYEEGFRMADSDYQIGRRPRVIESTPQYKRADQAYRGNFGNRDEFRQGYREGLRSGYEDSIHDRKYRAVAAARFAARGLEAGERINRWFDAGFIAGFQAAANPATRKMEFCGGAQATSDPRYCDGFRRGFAFAVNASSAPAAQELARAALTSEADQLK